MATPESSRFCRTCAAPLPEGRRSLYCSSRCGKRWGYLHRRTLIRERSCLVCRSAFVVHARSKQWLCSAKCRLSKVRNGVTGSSLRTCRHCGAEFRRNSGKGWFCSRVCGWAGLRKQPRVKPDRRCQRCSAQISRGKWCSDCRALIDRDKKENQYRARAEKRYGARQPRECVVCGAEFAPTYRGAWQKHCSKKCGRRTAARASRMRQRKIGRVDRKHTSRARRYGVPRVYNITLRGVAVRDRWRCHLCGERVSIKHMGTNHDRAPSIDHVVPLSAEGSPGHVWSNVRLAHRACNTNKNARPLGQQGLF
jgi:predicted nucleic acid-binding Zn ribbon protein